MQSALEPTKNPQRLSLSSTSFADGERLPARHSADGEDLSPPLRWSPPPQGTRSLALVCHAPDAPMSPFVHWLAWNIRADRRELPEGISSTASDEGMCQGQNGFGTHGYAGPNPPPGGPAQKLVFHLYALDTELRLPTGATRGDFEEAIAGRVLGEGTLTGRYSR